LANGDFSVYGPKGSCTCLDSFTVHLGCVAKRTLARPSCASMAVLGQRLFGLGWCAATSEMMCAYAILQGLPAKDLWRCNMAPVKFSRMALPKHWTGRIRASVLHVVSLAQYSLAYVRGWAADSAHPRLRSKAELE